MLISIIKSCCLFPLFHSPLPLALAHTHTHSMLRVWSYYCKKLLNIHTISTLPFAKCIHFISLLACFVMIFFDAYVFFSPLTLLYQGIQQSFAMRVCSLKKSAFNSNLFEWFTGKSLMLLFFSLSREKPPTKSSYRHSCLYVFFRIFVYRNSNWIPAKFLNHSNRKDNRYFSCLIRKLKEKTMALGFTNVILSKLMSSTIKSHTITFEFSIYANELDSSCTSCSLNFPNLCVYYFNFFWG